MFASTFLTLVGMMLLASALSIPRCRAIGSRAVASTALLLLLICAPTLLHYLDILYPLDMVSIPLASILLFIGICMLAFPEESKAFIQEIAKKEKVFLTVLTSTLAVAGMLLICLGLQ